MATKKRTSLRSKVGKHKRVHENELKRKTLERKAELRILDAEDKHMSDAFGNTVERAKLKREKRKQLIVADLGVALGQTTTKVDRTPKYKSKGGKKIIEKEEGERFKAVLKEKTFKENPFAALKVAILKGEEKRN